MSIKLTALNTIRALTEISNQYQIEEQRKKVENALSTVKSSLEEGILPGGGAFYLY